MLSEEEGEGEGVEWVGEEEGWAVGKPGIGLLGGWELEGRMEERKASSSGSGDRAVSEGAVFEGEGVGWLGESIGLGSGVGDVGVEDSFGEDQSHPIATRLCLDGRNV